VRLLVLLVRRCEKSPRSPFGTCMLCSNYCSSWIEGVAVEGDDISLLPETPQKINKFMEIEFMKRSFEEEKNISLIPSGGTFCGMK